MNRATEVSSLLWELVNQIRVHEFQQMVFARSREALLFLVGFVLLSIGLLLWRRLSRQRFQSETFVLPVVFEDRSILRRCGFRYFPFLFILIGVPFFIVALASPQSRLSRQELNYPGHRIAILIDASLSMNTAFSTQQLRAGNTFLANVSAAEYFVRRRMESEYKDLVSLIEFGSQPYIVTPFTNDYENVLLSIGLVGTPEEYRRFPDHGTLIMEAIDRAVQLFGAFDFLDHKGNLMVIFSDGQDTHAVYEDRTLDDILQRAEDNQIPVYFIRTSYDQGLGDVLPDELWKEAVERTGGRFFPAANELSIINAINEIDRLSAGSIDVTEYTIRDPRYASYAVVGLFSWLVGIALFLSVKKFRCFP